MASAKHSESQNVSSTRFAAFCFPLLLISLLYRCCIQFWYLDNQLQLLVPLHFLCTGSLSYRLTKPRFNLVAELLGDGPEFQLFHCAIYSVQLLYIWLFRILWFLQFGVCVNSEFGIQLHFGNLVSWFLYLRTSVELRAAEFLQSSFALLGGLIALRLVELRAAGVGATIASIFSLLHCGLFVLQFAVWTHFSIILRFTTWLFRVLQSSVRAWHFEE